ncbi:MAG: hypothetical protein IKE01_03725 [Clostridia bacterium]|nr:hypothetical protein [Clostridia bacterium]
MENMSVGVYYEQIAQRCRNVLENGVNEDEARILIQGLDSAEGLLKFVKGEYTLPDYDVPKDSPHGMSFSYIHSCEENIRIVEELFKKMDEAAGASGKDESSNIANQEPKGEGSNTEDSSEQTEQEEYYEENMPKRRHSLAYKLVEFFSPWELEDED